MKKIIALLLSAVVCLSFAACGQSAPADVQDATVTEENTTPATEVVTEAAVVETIYNFGDTIIVNDGMFEFTPVFEGYAQTLANWPDQDYLTPEGKISGQTPYDAAEEKVMLYFSGTVNYIGDSKSNVAFRYDFTVDYDDGYLFPFVHGEAFNNGKGYHSGCGVTKDLEDVDWKYHNYYTFEPLSSNKTCYVRFCIEVPDQLKANPEKVFVDFYIGGEHYNFALAE